MAEMIAVREGRRERLCRTVDFGHPARLPERSGLIDK